MRPLVVVMQAFGPYAGEQRLDFADLRGAGFFLITGPTGSGKTTILDAMSFALYGVTSGGPENEGGRSGAAMRSDHARPDTPTVVRFDFALGDDLYRIERIPEQERPKRRGEGTTTQLQEATMWRLRRADDGGRLAIDGRPLATGWSKVTAKVEATIGFRSEQFRQVVMLPQGRFQKLLEADSKEREQILRALFDTGHYTHIELALKDEATDLRRAAEKVTTRRDEVLRQAEAESFDQLHERCAHLSVEADDAAAHTDAAELARDAALQGLAEARDTVGKLDELDAAAKALAELEARTAETSAWEAELAAARRAISLEDVARQVAEAQAALEASHAGAARDAARDAEADQTLSAARAGLQVEESRSAERDSAAAEVQRLRSCVGAVEDLATARQDAAAAEAIAEAARTLADGADREWRDAQRELTEVEAGWREGQAGFLARELRDGEPCPVCGAREHPAPARPAAGAATQTDLEELRAGFSTLLTRRDEIHQGLADAEKSVAAATALVAERQKTAPPEYADAAALRVAIAAAEALAGALRTAHETAVAGAHAAEVEAAAATAARTSSAGALAQAETQAERAATRHAERLSAAGFATAADWQAARREAASIEHLDALVTGHAEAVLKTAERLRLARAGAEGIARPDVEALAKAADDAAARARQAREAASGLAAAAHTAEKQLDRLGELAEAEAELGARYQVIGRLADVASGANPRHVSFQRYVLGAFLDDVLVAASHRLQVMSNGRYRLERTEQRSGGKLAAGLGLEAYDSWTGIARPVATLSGGETFMAALSLALGLAEVVQAHAGGIRLDTVFVDEGFGSLDDESLDQAISSLMGLNDGGRLVGIISHVSELRECIDARLEIRAGKTGSTATFVTS